jgi:hypothetical protein
MSRLEYTIDKKVEIRPHKFKELKYLYKVDSKTLKSWFVKFNIQARLKGAYFTIDTVMEIFEKLGHPYKMIATDVMFTFYVKPYTVAGLAKIYNVTPRTFKRNFIDPYQDEIGKPVGSYYTIQQVEKIIAINEFSHHIYLKTA